MNSILGALGAAVAGLLAAAPALALPTQTPFQITIGSTPSGTVVFDLDQDVMSACRYEMAWSYPAVPGEQCFVDETTVPAYRSCTMAAYLPLATFVTLPPPGIPCQAIGPDGQSTPVYALSAAEQPTNGALEGLIQLDSASTYYLPFHASPVQQGALLNGANMTESSPTWPISWGFTNR